MTQEELLEGLKKLPRMVVQYSPSAIRMHPRNLNSRETHNALAWGAPEGHLVSLTDATNYLKENLPFVTKGPLY